MPDRAFSGALASASPEAVLQFVREHLRAIVVDAQAREDAYRKEQYGRLNPRPVPGWVELSAHRVRGLLGRARRAFVGYPQVAAALLDDPGFKALHAHFIGVFARSKTLRPAMIERAHAGFRGSDEVIMRFIDIAEAERDRGVLDVVEQLMSPAKYRSCGHRLARTCLALGDVEAAGRTAVLGVVRIGEIGPLLQFLDPAGARPMPAGGYEALVALEAPERTRMPATLRRMGRPDLAAELDMALARAGRGVRRAFDVEMKLLASGEAARALDGAERKVLGVAGQADIPLAFSFELADLLRAVPLDAATAPRVLSLAAGIEVVPLRADVVARVDVYRRNREAKGT